MWHILDNFPIQVDVTDVIAPEHVLFVCMWVFLCSFTLKQMREKATFHRMGA